MLNKTETPYLDFFRFLSISFDFFRFLPITSDFFRGLRRPMIPADGDVIVDRNAPPQEYSRTNQ